MYPYRVFLSYARPDVELVQRIADLLIGIGLEPLWDQQVNPGTPFSDEIRGLISRAHVFIPILTAQSQNRAWIHQETGFAVALNIPVLPISIGNLPTEMLSPIQALITDAELTGLEKTLRSYDFERLIVPPPANPFGLFFTANFPAQRTELLVKGAKWVESVNGLSPLRIQGKWTSFSIPNRPLGHEWWAMREGIHPRPIDFLESTLEERRALERHINAEGAKIILYPHTMESNGIGPSARKARLLILRDFFANFPLPYKLQLAVDRSAEEDDLLIVGDHFMAESHVRRVGLGHAFTNFVAHAPSVLRKIREFDQRFDQLPDHYSCAEMVTLLDELIAAEPD